MPNEYPKPSQKRDSFVKKLGSQGVESEKILKF
ncbi:hypothetical protein L8106_10692 [Lyngbya sp. PCC 8106]|nr:hypothetical protein L8106_10692 [Lyngbya sp. PCC 8106]